MASLLSQSLPCINNKTIKIIQIPRSKSYFVNTLKPPLIDIMRSHIVVTLALTFLLSQVSADLDVDTQDVPVACQAVCRPTLELSRTCDVDDDLVGGDAAEVQGEQACYCQNQSFDVGRMTALCQSCVQQNAIEINDARGEITSSILHVKGCLMVSLKANSGCVA